ncbi:uncharacterized protein EDB91DRAFT_1240354 [Suillus paluster]|uniref:uncharacterized protein n=1 Tax=Suillus paluster TaxID=48578 RepID=UPI001B864BE2|nr:uncharacterized protein EDB91DRAFT_1240354 [Suillus paluster]KAG1721016.1 hypothetical protein EDB91DRAFT_1240354 [Suillus paluster]
MLFLGGDDWVGDLNQQDFIPLPLPTSMSQNDYLRQWVPRTNRYLSILLEREAPADRSCIICGSDGVYKCHNCFGQEHQRLPFHRISQWTGGFFKDCCLVKTGHGGNPCPCQDYGVDDADEGFFAAADTDTDTDTEHATTPTANASKNNHDLPTGVPFIKNDKTMTTIVDKSGYCMCADAPSADLQLFRLGLFPASFTQPKTAFTFDVLDDFLLDNLECGTKLRRMTTNVFPHLVPLMRVARQWRQLKLLKWNGFGHEEKDPGINVTLPTEEHLETPSWLYSRSLVMDGNFKAEHMHAANPIDEVPLMDGRGFMVGDGKYKAHLALAKDAVQRSECNNHCAVNQANASRHRLEATGIGGCACARHGCFVPHAMVDFQKGERYAISGIRRALTFYDVNCQYNKYLKDRVADSPYLQIQEQMEIIPGIGLWHVHGHQDSCYVRYASNFIAGATRIDGEIMETLWAPLNIISPSARGMGTPHRKECLDYQMNDCNFMKMIRMSKALCRKFRQAVKGLANSREAFEKLDQSADENNVRDWGEQERLAQEQA